ncbi:hypothetical protein MLD38_040236 [Melastoma candidum]|uniref:Uncharacterized protein n=1 Tax=Melastoma candidum TaxID=119954 RepID=A0ACB9L4K5_9MYRT|nr:hypothetical protein MLD38_040236 [Melastoma candidum]
MKSEQEQTREEALVLDLPGLALDCILECLPPSGLFSMACVCSSLRERCSGDFLWERHVKQKWGGLIGRTAHREWEMHVSSRKGLSDLSPASWGRPGSVLHNGERKSYVPSDTMMSWYVALETGKFWFPAQVYNRENGHAGFMLSCYDAQLCYDSKTDTFQARYPPLGRSEAATESGIPWDRVRAPPVNTPPHDLHVSDCLQDLRPGDNIEIQWKLNQEFPYGWWYGVIGHQESCDQNSSFCRCPESDAVVLEFNQFPQGSEWWGMTLDRRNHREAGNNTYGFYGGIRKLQNEKEISTWKQHWPSEVFW